jgi:hypothetical protein
MFAREKEMATNGIFVSRFNSILVKSIIAPVSVLLCMALTRPDFAIAQAGALDKAFGKGGIFLGQSMGLSSTTAAAMAIQNNGDIVVAGESNG